MATLILGSVTREEIANNAGNSFASLIKSGQIVKVECYHSKNGNPIIQAYGLKMVCTDFNGNDFNAEVVKLYNPAQVKNITDLCDDSTTPIFVVNGKVSKTAPATANTSDTVKPKADLLKEIGDKMAALRKAAAIETDEKKLSEFDAKLAELAKEKGKIEAQ